MIGNKGEGWIADTLPFYVLFAIVVGIMFLLFVLFVDKYTTTRTSIPNGLEEDVLEARFLSTACFETSDSMQRPTAMLDWEKFNKMVFDSCFTIGQKPPAYSYKLRLSTGDGQKMVSAANWNEKGNEQTKVQKVRVLKNGAVSAGKLFIEVQHEQ